MSTFEGGWTCTNCWKANRESDLVCYRCKALQPGYRLVPDEPRRREPRTSLLRPVARRVAAAGRVWTAGIARTFRKLAHSGLAAGRSLVMISVNVTRATFKGLVQSVGAVRPFVARISRTATKAGQSVVTAAMQAGRLTIGASRSVVVRLGLAVAAAAIGLGAAVNRTAASLGARVRWLATVPHHGHQQR